MEGKIYSLSLKSLSRRVSLSTTDCLFDSNKACMNEKSRHLTNVSAIRGDKQGRAGGEERKGEERRGEEKGWAGKEERVFFFSCGRPFSAAELCQAVSGQKRNNHHSFSLRVSVSASQYF